MLHPTSTLFLKARWRFVAAHNFLLDQFHGLSMLHTLMLGFPVMILPLWWPPTPLLRIRLSLQRWLLRVPLWVTGHPGRLGVDVRARRAFSSILPTLPTPITAMPLLSPQTVHAPLPNNATSLSPRLHPLFHMMPFARWRHRWVILTNPFCVTC